jgi:hypothetical protein
MNTFEAILMGIEIGYRWAEEERRNPPKSIKPAVIIDAVSTYYSVSWEQMVSACRKREYVQARQVAMYLLSFYTRMTLVKIGQKFGGRDHTTIIHSRDTVRDLMQVDDNFCAQVKELISAITKGEDIIPEKRVTKERAVMTEPQPKKIVRFRWDREPAPVRSINRPAATYSNTGHINLLKSLEA